MDYQDEMYVFRDAPYSREKLHIIFSIDPSSFDPKQLARGDKASKQASSMWLFSYDEI